MSKQGADEEREAKLGFKLQVSLLRTWIACTLAESSNNVPYNLLFA
jgi:hypothetical protein